MLKQDCDDDQLERSVLEVSMYKQHYCTAVPTIKGLQMLLFLTGESKGELGVEEGQGEEGCCEDGF